MPVPSFMAIHVLADFFTAKPHVNQATNARPVCLSINTESHPAVAEIFLSAHKNVSLVPRCKYK